MAYVQQDPEQLQQLRFTTNKDFKYRNKWSLKVDSNSQSNVSRITNLLMEEAIEIKGQAVVKIYKWFRFLSYGFLIVGITA